MAVLFLGASASDLGGAGYDVTTAGTFDSAYSSKSVRYAFTYNAPAGWVMHVAEPASADFWLHFVVKLPLDNSGLNADGKWLDIFSGSGNLLAQIDVLDGAYYAVAVGTSTVTGPGFTINNTDIREFDLHVNVGATDLTFEIYLGGIVQSSATVAHGSRGKPTRVVFAHDDFTSSYNAVDVHYSQVIATDGEPTIGWKLSEMRPNLAGAYSEWTGGVAELKDSDGGTRAVSDTAGQRVSFSNTAYLGGTGASVRGVFQKSLADVGAAGPTKMKHFLRTGTVNYDGPELAPDGVKPLITEWTTNPATGAAWSTADLDSFEAGLLSVL